MTPWLLLLAAYLLGSIPSSLWVGRVFYGVDLRNEGSGNLGATNSYRVLGRRAAIPVLLFDVLKGWIPAYLFPLLPGAGLSQEWGLAYGGAAILGHAFSFWVGFRGGKGVATSTGVFLALAPWAILGSLGIWLLVLGAGRIVSLASIVAAAALPFLHVVTPTRGGTSGILFAFAVSAFVIFAHRGNLRRLKRGEEPRIGGGSGSPIRGRGSPNEVRRAK